MKNLNKIQKGAFILFLVACCVTIIGSFCFFGLSWTVLEVDKTGTNTFYETQLLENSVLFATDEQGWRFYYQMWDHIQIANQVLFTTGIIGVFGVAIFAILGGHNRRHYYKSNLISGIVIGALTIILSIVSIALTTTVISDFAYCANDYVMPSDEAIANWVETGLTDSTWSPYAVAKAQAMIGERTAEKLLRYEITYGSAFIGIIIPIILIIISGLFIASVIVKYHFTCVKNEKKEDNLELDDVKLEENTSNKTIESANQEVV